MTEAEIEETSSEENSLLSETMTEDEPYPHSYLVGGVATVAYGVFSILFLIVLSKVRMNISLPNTVVGPPADNTILVIVGAVFVCLAMFAWFFAIASVYAGGFKGVKKLSRKVISAGWILALIITAVSIAGWVIVTVVLA